MERIISRAEGGIVPLTHTTARVARPARWLLVHHTGDTGWPKSGWSDAQHMSALQSVSSGMGKTWEYNYVITHPQGWIWEQAGEFQGAHCLNANGWSYGVQLNQANSAGRPPQALIDSFRWLRAHLVETGQLTPDHQCGPHYRLRATGCSATDLAEPPGARWASPTGEGSLGNVIGALLVPWIGADVPVTDAEMEAIATKAAKKVWAMNLTSESGLSTSEVTASRWLTTAGDHAFVANQTLSKIDPVAIKLAVKEACGEALADAQVVVSDENIEAIAKGVLDRLTLVQRVDT